MRKKNRLRLGLPNKKEREWIKYMQAETTYGGWAEIGQGEPVYIKYKKEKEEKISRYISKAVQREVWRRDFGKCVECGSKERLEYDHIIPFSKGGSNTARNIQLLCENCNRKKHNRIG